MEDQQNTENASLLRKVPEQEMKPLIEGYLNYVQKFKYLRYIVLGVMAVIVGYNLFVAGKRFPLEELNTIKIAIASLMGVFVLLLIGLGWVLFKTLRKLKGELNTTAHKHGIDEKPLRKEFHIFVKANLGGPGLR